MLEHLNPKTRSIAHQLMTGDAVSIGGARVGPFNKQEQISLRLLANNMAELRGKGGASLADAFVALRRNLQHEKDDGEGIIGKPFEAQPTAQSTGSASGAGPKWRIGKLLAQSFRGLAPAGQQWDYDFEGRTHLLHGPNGCGKSSLLGAICWCFTGRIFRDDCEPSSPQLVEVYRVSGDAKHRTERPDALTLVTGDGNSSRPDDAYSVAVQLLRPRANIPPDVLWLRRHSVNGLEHSQDGSIWEPLRSVEDVGISELDAELHLLMPARVSHLRFGKNPDLVRLFTQVVGMEDLEEIAELAGKCCTASRNAATRKENNELAPQREAIRDSLQEIQKTTPKEVQAWPEYTDLFSSARDLKTIEALGERLARACTQHREALAKDLDLQIPAEGSSEYATFLRHLKNLPGQVQSAVEFLSRPVAQIMAKSVGLTTASQEELNTLECALSALEADIAKQVTERLDWAREETADPKAGLLLLASDYFEPGANVCPVCAQDLQPVPSITNNLLSLQGRLCQPHLKKQIEDHERELLARLDALVPAASRKLGEEPLSSRVLADWTNLKENHMPGLLAAIADKFDIRINDIAGKCASTRSETPFAVPVRHQDGAPYPYRRIEEELNAARRYLSLAESMTQHEAEMRAMRETIASNEDPSSLVALLNQGSATNEALSACDVACKSVQDLYRKQKAVDTLAAEIDFHRSLADSTEPVKRLGDLVRSHVIDQVRTVEPQMRSLYEKLYDQELLPFDLLTAGHAKNDGIKDEINAYLRAGEELVPIGPFSNAGRLRALALSFVFALLSKSEHTLDVLVLDDPALSMDDQHKDRFLTHLVAPAAQENQILLGTHYDIFFQRAQVKIGDAERLCLTPRRASADAVGFEPADLLERVEHKLKEPTTYWQDCAINLRMWVERVLGTLSAYSPEPFIVYRKLWPTIEKYASIRDPRVDTPGRQAILRLLTEDFIKTLHRFTAHPEENPTDTDVQDMLTTLKQCERHVTAEIKDFKEYYYHDMAAMAIEARPVIQPLTIRRTTRVGALDIVGRAAASDRGTGIEWQEHERLQLEEFGLAVATLDVIAPIALPGQVLLLDHSDRLPENRDLVVARTHDGEHYLRRFWKRDDASVVLEGAHPTCPYEPVLPGRGTCETRRVVGVLFDQHRCIPGRPGKEWIEHTGSPPVDLSGFYGVRVHGNSMEPVARHGQMVLIRESSDLRSLGQGELACVDIESLGTVVKRCFFADGRRFLISVNQTDVTPPIVVPDAEIRQGKVYVLRGVLFECTPQSPE